MMSLVTTSFRKLIRVVFTASYKMTVLITIFVVITGGIMRKGTLRKLIQWFAQLLNR